MEMGWSKAVVVASSPTHFPLNNQSPFLSPSSPPLLSLLPTSSSSSSSSSPSSTSCFAVKFSRKQPPTSPSFLSRTSFQRRKQLCRAAEYKFPDPIPEFAETEADKFKAHLLKKLSKKDIYGGCVDDVLEICTEIFRTFLHTEYGGPGTLMVVPFIDMADTINERGLPGGPQAARSAVVWAQKHVDKDWNEWTGGENN